MTGISVIIPYAGDDLYRQRSLEDVQDLYYSELPEFDVSVIRGEEKRFSRAALLNQGVADAKGQIIVVNDADSLCWPAQIREAAALAEEAPGLVWAYTQYRRLSREGTEAVFTYRDALVSNAVEWEMVNAPSNGCAAIRRSCWLDVGGMDEGFQGWGYEDIAFNNRCASYWPLRRVTGPLVHLWHGDRRADDSPVSANPSDVRRNQDRLIRSGGYGFR